MKYQLDSNKNRSYHKNLHIDADCVGLIDMPSKQARAAMIASIGDHLCLYTFYENVIARVQGLHGDVSFCGTPSFIFS